jgi:hypothetical protein
MRAEDLVLRCYGYKTRRNTWLAVCIDLTLAVEEDTLEAAKAEMEAQIKSYFETVFATDDGSSTAHLVFRRAPLKDLLIYYFVKTLCNVIECPWGFRKIDQTLPLRPSFA